MGNMHIEPERGCRVSVPRDEETFNYIVSQRMAGEIRNEGVLLNSRQLNELKKSKVIKRGRGYFLKTTAHLSRSDIIAIATSLANRLGKAIRYENENISFTARPGDCVSELEAKLMKI